MLSLSIYLSINRVPLMSWVKVDELKVAAFIDFTRCDVNEITERYKCHSRGNYCVNSSFFLEILSS